MEILKLFSSNLEEIDAKWIYNQRPRTLSLTRYAVQHSDHAVYCNGQEITADQNASPGIHEAFLLEVLLLFFIIRERECIHHSIKLSPK